VSGAATSLTGEQPPGDERVRLFVALELPDDARETLVRWRGRVPGGAERLRLIASDDLHATLCFLGWRSAGDISAIRDTCNVVAGRTAPELVLGEAIWLPPRRPRVLAVSLQDRSGSLAAVQSALSEALAAGGWYEPEKRAHLAHVTVARAGRGFRTPRGELPAPPALEFRASRVTLYRSRLLRTGARYEPLGAVELSTG